MGSKARIAKEILPIILNNRNHRPYLEPFAGGMNMICEVSQNEGERYANDLNKYIIALFKELNKGWIPPNFITKDFYEHCKEGNCEDYMRGYVGVCCSYSGKWFGGYAGITKTKVNIRNYIEEAFKNLMLQSLKMKEVYFCSANYYEIDIPKNAIIYCDPPYEGTTNYKNEFDHSYFWDWVRQISTKHEVFISEYNAPEDFEILWQKEVKSSLSANGNCGGSKLSTEKLFKMVR